MLLDILSRIFLYTFLLITIFYSTRLDNPIKVILLRYDRLVLFIKKIWFLTDWGIFTFMEDNDYEVEIIAELKSGKILKWFLSKNKCIGDIKIYNYTVKKNTLAHFMAYRYFHEVVEKKLLNYAFDTLKDPMVSLKFYLIKFNIDKNKDFILGKKNRPIPKSPPEVIYEAKWQY